LKKADAFSAISPEIASEWISSGISAEKVHLIPNTVDTNRYFPADAKRKNLLRKKLNLPQDVIIAIYTGRLVSYKGLPLLLKVWNEIRRTHEKTLLILAGTGGLDIHNCEDELRKYVRDNELENALLFTGMVTNVPEYLQASDLFVFPTENDAFPSSVIEAMACGLPVIATPVGAIKNIITDNQTGILIQPSDFEQLYQALHVILIDKNRFSLMGEAARRSVQGKYSAKPLQKNTRFYFKTLLNPRKLTQYEKPL
jgi:glycosyltransferase involved in cell wall biosynthesis